MQLLLQDGDGGSRHNPHIAALCHMILTWTAFPHQMLNFMARISDVAAVCLQIA